MKKSLLFVAVVSMLFLNVSLCLAFPEPGRYGSEEKARASDTGELLDIPLWRLEVDRADCYSGKLLWASRGIWIGDWTAPLGISPNKDGRYELESRTQYSVIKMEIQETSETSFIMYVKYKSSRSAEEYTVNMRKIE